MKQAVKSVGNKVKQAVAQTTKQIGQELYEIPKQAVGEATYGIEKPEMDNWMANNPPQKISTSIANSSKPSNEVIQRLDYLHKELEELRQKNLTEEMNKRKSDTEASDQSNIAQESIKPLPESTSISRRLKSMFSGGRKSKTAEIPKQVK